MGFKGSQKTGCISSSKLTLSIKFNNPFVTKILWSQEALRNFHFDYPLKTQLLLFSRVIVTSFGSFLHHTKSCSKSFLASQNITLGMENTGKIYFSKSLLITLNRPKLIKRSIVDNSIPWINLYPVDYACGFPNTCLLKRDIPGP